MFGWFKKKPIEKVELLQYIPPLFGRKTFYLCDGKACGDFCPNPNCYHTTDVTHAKNFRAANCGEDRFDYWEER